MASQKVILKDCELNSLSVLEVKDYKDSQIVDLGETVRFISNPVGEKSGSLLRVRLQKLKFQEQKFIKIMWKNHDPLDNHSWH
jgi:hypothetical protein